MNYLMCRATATADGRDVVFDSVETRGLTLSQTVEDDRKYGKFNPSNGEYFTYIVMNEDEEFTEEQVHKAVRYAYKRWWLYADLPKLKRVGKDHIGPIDFKIVFHTVESDPDGQMEPNTIMYHYFPIHNETVHFRGLCVVNKRFFFTSHGNSVKGEEMQRHGVPVEFPNSKYNTFDFDMTYAHELGHGLGLPHDSEPDSIMSTPYSVIREMPSVRDQSRISVKYGYRWLSGWKLRKWLSWLWIASDRT